MTAYSIPWVKKQAKKLLKEIRSGAEPCPEGFTADSIRLGQVQHIVARDLGYENWLKLLEANR